MSKSHIQGDDWKLTILEKYKVQINSKDFVYFEAMWRNIWKTPSAVNINRHKTGTQAYLQTSNILLATLQTQLVSTVFNNNGSIMYF